MNNEEKILQMLFQLTTKVSGMEADIKDLKSDVKEIKTKLDTVYSQTANLTEFKASTLSKLDKLSDDLDFITHKEQQTEKEVFTIKKKLKLAK